jgi:RimJ/RimL family protein N-acetyltransferase
MGVAQKLGFCAAGGVMAGVIRTKRLVLRPLQQQDAEPIFSLFNNWEVVRRLSSPPWPYTLDHARDFIRNRMKPRQNPAEAIFIITADGKLAGVIDWMPSTRAAGGSPTLGYWLGQPYWGRGYMSEAARAFIAYIFAEGAGESIRSGAFADNMASLRVQEKLGFERIGESMLHSQPRGAAFPHVDTILKRSIFERKLA